MSSRLDLFSNNAISSGSKAKLSENGRWNVTSDKPSGVNTGQNAMIWSVSALSQAIRDNLNHRFQSVTLMGELSGVTLSSGGHWYFCIKDRVSQLRCVLFQRVAQQFDFPLRDGLQVQLDVQVDVYSARGDLQLIVQRMQIQGKGSLYEQFLQLKDKLQSQGLFDGARKRALKKVPQGIAIVTSLQAAALKDVLTTLERRSPHVPIWIFPASVQGIGSADELSEALSVCYQQVKKQPIEAILLVRGGGSIEDLWSFNDEKLAQTIVKSPVPLISGIGHETDFTIADFCADVRAATPTAAAELVAQPLSILHENIAAQQQQLQRKIHQIIDDRAQALDYARHSIQKGYMYTQTLDSNLKIIAYRLRTIISNENANLQQELHYKHRQLLQTIEKNKENREDKMQLLSQRLKLLDPQRVLERGYALVTDDNAKPVTQKAVVKSKQMLTVHFADGLVEVKVENK